MARISVTEAGGPNVCAFIDGIAWAEIGPTMLADPRSDDGYRILVGSRPGKLLLFDSYAHHPQVLNHALDSTAAGRYQIIRGTALGVSGELGITDFSPVSQDRIAIELLRGRGALPYIARGEIAKAYAACNQEWASLPGAGATLPDGTPQHEQRMGDLLAVYETALKKYG